MRFAQRTGGVDPDDRAVALAVDPEQIGQRGGCGVVARVGDVQRSIPPRAVGSGTGCRYPCDVVGAGAPAQHESTRQECGRVDLRPGGEPARQAFHGRGGCFIECQGLRHEHVRRHPALYAGGGDHLCPGSAAGAAVGETGAVGQKSQRGGTVAGFGADRRLGRADGVSREFAGMAAAVTRVYLAGAVEEVPERGAVAVETVFRDADLGELEHRGIELCEELLGRDSGSVCAERVGQVRGEIDRHPLILRRRRRGSGCVAAEPAEAGSDLGLVRSAQEYPESSGEIVGGGGSPPGGGIGLPAGEIDRDPGCRGFGAFRAGRLGGALRGLRLGGRDHGSGLGAGSGRWRRVRRRRWVRLQRIRGGGSRRDRGDPRGVLLRWVGPGDRGGSRAGGRRRARGWRRRRTRLGGGAGDRWDHDLAPGVRGRVREGHRDHSGNGGAGGGSEHQGRPQAQLGYPLGGTDPALDLEQSPGRHLDGVGPLGEGVPQAIFEVHACLSGSSAPCGASVCWRAARPRLACVLTEPREIPRVSAISASLRSR